MDVNLLLRGQSNALLFADFGGMTRLEQGLEAALPGVDVHLLYRWNDGGGANTINSGTEFLTEWMSGTEAGRLEQGLLSYIQGQSADIKDNPTLELWMHNESDQKNSGSFNGDWWKTVYEANKAMVEQAFGHSVTTEFVPIRYNWGNIGPILDGMKAAVADGTAHGIDMSAYDLAKMDWGGTPNTEHMGGSDAAAIADALAKNLAPLVQEIADGGAGSVPTPTPTPTPKPTPAPTPVELTAGSGPDSLVLKVNQDAYQGSAQYTVSVDGEQVGGTFTASSGHGSGVSDTLTLKGDWGAGEHRVEVRFLNDAWGGTAATDRNLYVDAATYNGKAVSGAAQAIETDTAAGAFSFTEAGTPTPTPTPTPGDGGWVESFDGGEWGRFTHWWGNIETNDGDVVLTGLTGQMEKPSGREAGDGYGLREVVAKIEGSGAGPAIVMWPGSDLWPGPEIDIGEINYDGSGQYGALHWKGDDGSDQYQLVDIGDNRGAFHTYGIDWQPDHVAFLVDGVEKGRVTQHVPVDYAHGGEDDTIGWLSSIGYGPGDGRISVQEVRFTPMGGSAPTPPPSPTPTVELTAGSGPDSLVLKISQDAYQGDAQYTVKVDGKQVGGTFTASAAHADGLSDTLTLKGDWGPGEHKVEVAFLNDKWGGTAATDRNLHVDAATYNGQAVQGAAKALMKAGAQGFAFTEAAPPPDPTPDPLTAGSGPDSLVLKVSQDAYQGDAQYTVKVDGVQVGGTFTASSLHSSGLSDTLTLKGDWAPGEHKVEVAFLNDAWGGTAATDRNLHVDSASYNGKAVAGATQAIESDWQPGAFSFSDASAPAPAPVAKTGTDGADLFDATEAGGLFTGKGGRDMFVFEAGDGPVTVTDFATGTDKLLFIGLDEADVTAAPATSGPPGLVVHYGDAGGTVFLAGVSALAERDLAFG